RPSHPSIPSALCRCKNPHSSPSHYLNAIQSLVGTYLLDLQFVMSLVGIEGDREDDRIADVIPPAESAVQVVSPMRENYHVKQDTRKCGVPPTGPVMTSAIGSSMLSATSAPAVPPGLPLLPPPPPRALTPLPDPPQTPNLPPPRVPVLSPRQPSPDLPPNRLVSPQRHTNPAFPQVSISSRLSGFSLIASQKLLNLE
ncbi:hypothetical protein BGW80DRAFT_1354576, partial [Lactifluus volemus]